LIKWSYPQFFSVSGISGQTTQQNHSIYAFRQSKYVGLFDIDEYINIQKNDNTHHRNINDFFDELIVKENIDISKIGSFRLLNKFFYNPNNLPTEGNNFLKIFNCDKITKGGQEKNFVLPKNINTFAVHMITDGNPMYNIDDKLIFFNHYYFLNKSSRGRNNTNLIDDSILFHIEEQN